MHRPVCVFNSLTYSVLRLQREDTLALFSAMLYECVTQECPEMLPTYIAIEQVTHTHTHTHTHEVMLLNLTDSVFVLQLHEQAEIMKNDQKINEKSIWRLL